MDVRGRGGGGKGEQGEGGGKEGGRIGCVTDTRRIARRDEPKSQSPCQIPLGSVLVTASLGHYGQSAARIGLDRIYARSDFPHPIRFCSFKEGPDNIVLNRPGSDLDGVVRVWPNPSGSEASRCARIIGPGFWQNATGPLPVSHFQTGLPSSTDGPEHSVQNQPGSGLVLADCQVLAVQIRSGSKPGCETHPARFWPTLPIRSGWDANRIRHVY